MFWGKVIGGLLGYSILGGFGLLIGLFIGHHFDQGLRQYNFFMGGGAAQLNSLKDYFFEALFSCMGRVAKADGRVSEHEIQVARAIMQSMQLSQRKTQQAMEFFNQGKSAEFNMQAILRKLKQESRGNRSLLRMFMQLQFQAAYANGALHPAQEKELLLISQGLGFSAFEYQQAQAMFRAQYEFAEHHQDHFYGYRQSGSQSRSFESSSHQDINQAYKILGVTSGTTQDQVKKAYRRLINEYHPDKLAAKGLPDEMMKAATEKTTKIQLAYEMIKKHKGWK